MNATASTLRTQKRAYSPATPTFCWSLADGDGDDPPSEDDGSNHSPMVSIAESVKRPMKRFDSQLMAVKMENACARILDGTISVSKIQQTDPWPREKPEMKRRVAATACKGRYVDVVDRTNRRK